MTVSQRPHASLRARVTVFGYPTRLTGESSKKSYFAKPAIYSDIALISASFAPIPFGRHLAHLPVKRTTLGDIGGDLADCVLIALVFRGNIIV